MRCWRIVAPHKSGYRLCLARIKSAFEINNIQARHVALLHGSCRSCAGPDRDFGRGRPKRHSLDSAENSIDLEQSKSAVLNSLTSSSSKRSYDHAIREFIDWYCSEPRLAFNRTVVTRYRIALEQHLYAPSTINLRLAAIRRLAYEASDCGLLSPDLAAGIRRVKGLRPCCLCIRRNGYPRVVSEA
jgi:hypothetical protein